MASNMPQNINENDFTFYCGITLKFLTICRFKETEAGS
ncbi:hypothetical protein CHCC14819_2629 [Bacillus licheniformis]|nr:hypothetical protein CHCC14819_2629 [Bacillus licheniformis]